MSLTISRLTVLCSLTIFRSPDLPTYGFYLGCTKLKEFASRLSPHVLLNEKIDVARLELDYDSDYA